MIFNKTTTTLAPRINTALGNNLSISNKVNLTFNLDLHSLAFNSNKFYSTNEEKDTNNQTNVVNINDSFDDDQNIL